MEIKVGTLNYQELNAWIRESFCAGQPLTLTEVNGQRFIGCGLSGEGVIDITGVPGNDLGAFLNGPTIRIHNNAQDQLGNTMNTGEIVVEGNAGDTTGYSMRGGEIYVRGYAGSRVGIHMKEYKQHRPVMVVGGHVGDFCGEYMAGGLLIVLGQGAQGAVTGDYCATGIHGGQIFLRGHVNRAHIGAQASVSTPTREELSAIEPYLRKYAAYFSADADALLKGPWTRIAPQRHDPYAGLYANNVY